MLSCNESSPLLYFNYLVSAPVRARTVKSRMCPPYPQRDRKRRLNGPVCRKGWSRVGARTGTLKNPTKCLWRWEPDRRSNFFSPPAHLCRHIYDLNIINCDVKQPIYLTLPYLVSVTAGGPVSPEGTCS